MKIDQSAIRKCIKVEHKYEMFIFSSHSALLHLLIGYQINNLRMFNPPPFLKGKANKRHPIEDVYWYR